MLMFDHSYWRVEWPGPSYVRTAKTAHRARGTGHWRRSAADHVLADRSPGKPARWFPTRVTVVTCAALLVTGDRRSGRVAGMGCRLRVPVLRALGAAG